MERIRDELKDFKSNRKATLKLLSLVSNTEIFMGKHKMYIDNKQIHVILKNKKFMGGCWVCGDKFTLPVVQLNINNNINKLICCSNCRKKKLCHSCLRKVSRCSQIHTRKLLCYKFLLSKKIPKDVIRLITKKVK